MVDGQPLKITPRERPVIDFAIPAAPLKPAAEVPLLPRGRESAPVLHAARSRPVPFRAPRPTVALVNA